MDFARNRLLSVPSPLTVSGLLMALTRCSGSSEAPIQPGSSAGSPDAGAAVAQGNNDAAAGSAAEAEAGEVSGGDAGGSTGSGTDAAAISDAQSVDAGTDAAAISDAQSVDAGTDASESSSGGTDSGPVSDTGASADTGAEAATWTTPVLDQGRPVTAQEPVAPQVDESGGRGNVTTYGNVLDPMPSEGGACNYGITSIYGFAAINVNVEPGDGQGQWNGGRICGQCARVTVATDRGELSAVVRIVDKCPDDHCGIDLGGGPAATVMGTAPGRYSGVWQFIPCDGLQGVSDGPPSLFVKEGSNAWWALVQVRNPPAAVLGIRWEAADGSASGEFAYATEAENYYAVPEEVRANDAPILLTVSFDFGIEIQTQVTGSSLTVENALYPLQS